MVGTIVREKSKCLTVTCDKSSILPNCSKRVNTAVARLLRENERLRSESKRLTVTCDRLLQILHSSQMIKSGHGNSKVVEKKKVVARLSRKTERPDGTKVQPLTSTGD